MALIVGLALLASPAQARTLRACVSDRPTFGLTYPDRDGPMQYLIREAARMLGDEVQFVVEPRRRCLESVEHGRYEILALSAGTDSLVTRFAHPLRGNKPDVARAALLTGVSVVKRRGGATRWDGQHLDPGHGPVLVPRGYVIAVEQLERWRQAYQEVETTEQIVNMLRVGRADTALLIGAEAHALARAAATADLLEALEPPVLSAPMYVVFNRAFADREPDYVERFWNALARRRAAKDWPAIEKRMTEAR